MTSPINLPSITIRQTRDCLRCTTKPLGTYHGPGGFPIVSRKEINTALADPTMGGSALSGSPANFEKLIIDETEKWAKVIMFGGIKAD